METPKLEKDVRFYEYTLMFGREKSVISFYDILYELNAFHIPHSEHRDVRYHTQTDRETERDTMKSVIIMNKQPLCSNH